jgi:hypothetical protein
MVIEGGDKSMNAWIGLTLCARAVRATDALGARFSSPFQFTTAVLPFRGGQQLVLSLFSRKVDYRRFR